MHANTDEDGFVKKMTYTPSNVHDSKEFDKIGVDMHFIAAGGFSFTISGYFDIMPGMA
jgi:hypothetical protein